MADISKNEKAEHADPTIHKDAETSSDESAKVKNIHELLNDENDPDFGKSPEEKAAIDKKLMRRVDLWLIPWLCLLYLLSFLDRTNIGNARLAGIEEDLGMEGHDYNNTLTIFFISYALAEPATNVLLKRMTPRVFFTLIIVTWGIVMTLMGLVTNYEGLLAARFFLGLTEAGLYPGANYYLSVWYKRSELGMRTAIFFAMAALAGSFGGLLAAAIAQMDGIANHPGWAWIFILEGLVTVVVGVISWWMVFDWPETARFLSPEDRIRVQRRLLADGQTHASESFDKRHISAAFKDWKTYAFAIVWMGNLCPLYSFSLFLPTILGGMGYEGTTAQLLTVPPYAVAATMTLLVGYLADKWRMRGLFNMGCVTIAAIGFVMLIATPNPDVQYAGTFLAAAGVYPTIPNSLSWAANNFEGIYKRGVVIGTIVGWGNLNGVVSSNIFLTREEPRYWTGHAVVLSWQICFLFGGSLFIWIMLGRENAARRAGKRDHLLDGKTQEDIKFMGDQRPDFIYTR